MKKLIAILDNPTANPPGHTIKEARAPYVPVASVSCLPLCSAKVRAERRKLALVMAAGPDLLEAGKKVLAAWESGDLAAAVRCLDLAVEKAEAGE
jgi:hypothetical protein